MLIQRLTCRERQALGREHVAQLAPPAAERHEGAQRAQAAQGEADRELARRQHDHGQEEGEGQDEEQQARAQQGEEVRQTGCRQAGEPVAGPFCSA